MYKILLSAAVAMFSLAGAAQAATVVVPFSGYSYTMSNTGTLGTTTVASNANLATNSIVTVSYSGAAVVDGDEGGSHVLPVVGGGISNGTKYLSVYGGGTATFTLTQKSKSFAMNWGTIDAYNTLQVTDVSDHVYTVTGDALLPPNFSDVSGGTSSLYFMFNSVEAIKSIVMTSTDNSFEVSNLKISSIPLPGAALLFGSGLAGLVGAARKKIRG